MVLNSFSVAGDKHKACVIVICHFCEAKNIVSDSCYVQKLALCVINSIWFAANYFIATWIGFLLSVIIRLSCFGCFHVFLAPFVLYLYSYFSRSKIIQLYLQALVRFRLFVSTKE
jgi:hypothetical protein